MAITTILIKKIIMCLIGLFLIFLSIRKNCEPMLLIPIGFGCILINLPSSTVVNYTLPGIGEVNGAIEWLYNVGISGSEIMPLLLFIGIGAMIDFSPLIARPVMFLFGFAAHIGIFIVAIIAIMFGFKFNDALSIGIIGAADGPTSILVAQSLKSSFTGPVTIAAYSYMALVPIIQPFIIRTLTTKEERLIRMDFRKTTVSGCARIMFPIIVTILSGLLAPMSIPLVGFLMFGNLIRECGVLEKMSSTAQNELTNIITLLIGITISFNMKAENFLKWDTLLVLTLGLLAFALNIAFGILAAKILNIFLNKKINPLVGAAGISAFPMATRISQRIAQTEDCSNIILMQAAGANVAGQIASAVIGGIIINLYSIVI